METNPLKLLDGNFLSSVNHKGATTDTVKPAIKIPIPTLVFLGRNSKNVGASKYSCQSTSTYQVWDKHYFNIVSILYTYT